VLRKRVGKIMNNYPVGDFITRIKNAALAGKKVFSVPNTKLVYEVAKTLKKSGVLSEIKKEDSNLNLRLAYHKKEPLLINLKLVSKPGLRVYMNIDELSNHKGVSYFVLSTSKGVMTSKEALKLGIGGEAIAEIW